MARRLPGTNSTLAYVIVGSKQTMGAISPGFTPPASQTSNMAQRERAGLIHNPTHA